MDDQKTTKLERLIAHNNRHPTHTTATLVLQDLGTSTISFAVLDNNAISSHCISSGSDDISTLFQACSISKSVCSLLTFKLIQIGLLSLNASISLYLSQKEVDALETPATRGMAKHITISMLLSHTSGLETGGSQGFPGYDVSRNAAGHFRSALPDLKGVLQGQWPSNTLPIRLKDWPGHVFKYSGGGYAVMQLIIENITGKDFSTVMQEKIFTPLRMQRSTYKIPEDEDFNHRGKQGNGNYAVAYYNGYTSCEVPHRVNPEQSAAGLWTTPTDLLILTSAIQLSLHSENGFLPAHLARQMFEEVQAGMAHGWFVTAQHFGHGGTNMPGWKCNVLASFDGKRALCIMTNSAEGVVVQYKVQIALFHLLGWSKGDNFAYERGRFVPFADFSAALPKPEVMQSWVGMWKEEGKHFEVECLVEEGMPWLRTDPMPKQRLWIAAHGKEDYQDESKVVADLVCRGGLEVLVRLMEDKKGNLLMELWNGNTGQVTVMVKVL